MTTCIYISSQNSSCIRYNDSSHKQWFSRQFIHSIQWQLAYAFHHKYSSCIRCNDIQYFARQFTHSIHWQLEHTFHHKPVQVPFLVLVPNSMYRILVAIISSIQTYPSQTHPWKFNTLVFPRKIEVFHQSRFAIKCPTKGKNIPNHISPFNSPFTTNFNYLLHSLIFTFNVYEALAPRKG